MFIDTFQVADTFLRLPDEKCLLKYDWKFTRNKFSGEIETFYRNGEKGEFAPRLTISKGYSGVWNVYAEVSPSAWINGSNIDLMNESDFLVSLELLTEYVSDLSGYRFDTMEARVSRVDFTRNFYVGESAVLPIIKKYSHFNLPRYLPRPYPTSIYFETTGKHKNKIYKLYSKYDERLGKSKNPIELESSEGIIRLEIQHKKAAVNNLAKSLKLGSNKARVVLTEITAMQAIDDAMKRLRFSDLFNAESQSIKTLIKAYNGTTAMNLIGLLYLESKFGDVSTISDLNISAKTVKRYRDKCHKVGVLSLE